MNISNDRAWNDPPPRPFSNSESPSSKRTQLNKRVAFPLHKPGIPSCVGSKDSEEKATAPNIPPAESCPPIDIQCTGSRQKEEIAENESQNNLTDEEMLVAVQLTFDSLVKGLTQTSEEDVVAIKKRLTIFLDYWAMKLSPVVKKKMFQLTNELAAGKMAAAEKLCQELAVNNTREVAPWMVGVKHLIQNAQKSAPESTAKYSEEVQTAGPCGSQLESETHQEESS